MAIALTEAVVSARTLKHGEDNFTLAVGDRFRIQKRDAGDIIDLLDETVAAGKQWSVSIIVKIVETDA